MERRKMDDTKITVEKFEVLKLIDDISSKNKFGIAQIQDIINIITSRRSIKSVGVRKMVWELSKEGFIQNPLRGCWRLTEKGKKILEDVMKSQGEVI